MEAVGTVEAVGDGVDRGMVGSRVVAIPSGAFGGYAEYSVAPASMTFPMPEEIALPDAAAILMPFHLAALSLYVRAGVSKGETVLIHAAAGGVGSAAVQLAKVVGAQVIALAGSAEKAHFCAQLGADVAVDTSATDFVDAALEATGGRGVDVAFDTIGGDITVRTFDCMAFGGRHVLAGFASGIEAEDEGMVPRPILFGNFSLVGVCLAYVDDPLAVKAAVGSNFLLACRRPRLARPGAHVGRRRATSSPSWASTSRSRSCPRRSTPWSSAAPSVASSSAWADTPWRTTTSPVGS